MGHISTLKLHQLRYGELDDTEQAELKHHLGECDKCASRLSAQENHRAAFELMPVPEAIANLTPQPTLWERLTRPFMVGPLLVAALAMLFIVPSMVDGMADGTRSKGNNSIEILVEDYGILDEGESIRPGDRIQLRIPPGEWVEVWVGSNGAWLGSFPVHPSGAWQLVPFSLEVDSAPGAEDLVVLLANHPIDEAEAADALSGDALGGIEIHNLTLPKEL